MNDNVIINIEGLNFSYERIPTLKDINLKIRKNDFLAIIGPNGGGKSTFLKLILGLLKTDKGRIEIFGQKNSNVLNRLGYVPQKVRDEKFPITVKDVIFMGLEGNLKRKEKDESVREAANLMGVDGILNEHIHAISGGQRQRTFIARAIVSDPDILLLDEPTASIDSEGQIKIYELLKKLNKDKTILMVSHDLNLLTKYANTITVINTTACHHTNKNLPQNISDLYYQCPVEILNSSIKEKEND